MEALISFKSQIFVDELLTYNPLSTWDQNVSPCNWSGVSCNKHGERVIGLKLSNLRISGAISPYLGNLSFLRSIELQNNHFTGELPHQLGNLFRLRSLNLSFNSIEGIIPSNISRCKELRMLDLMQNRISGRIPTEISYLSQLQVLNLASNQLIGNLPLSLANISSLVHLNLGTNELVGSIPNEYARLVNLRHLDLTINNLSSIVPPSIYNLSSLVYLAFASNNLSGELPGDIAFTLPNLLGIDFCINKFTGTIPWSLHNLTNIRIIRIGHNLLQGRIPPGLGNLPNLEIYHIGLNSIVGGLDFLELLTNSTRLNFLAIDSNLLEGVIPESIGNLSKVLTKFFMGGNNIYGSIPSTICELKALDLLNMSYSSISGEIPQEIGQLTELRIPNSFANFQNLITLDLSNNKLNGSIPRHLFSLPRLSAFLNLSHNHFSGPIPEEIELLENVVTINISDNKLSGNIPDSISNCQSLEQLLLSRNELSGQIPDNLASVRGLETLDLSSNQLSSAIPFGLQSLQSLQLLNLSFNRLVGEIPKGGVFADSSKVYLESNQNLCSDMSCENTRKKRLTSSFIYVIISVSIVIFLCFVIGLIYYFRKGKGINKSSFEFLKTQHQMISYDDLRLATDNFSEEKLVGNGSFGFVYKGLLQGVVVAVKVLDATTARSRKSFLAECEALRNVRHRNLVKLVTICSSIDSKNNEFLALVYEFMSNGSLDDWLTGKMRRSDGTSLSLLDRLWCTIGIASAIDYLHNETQIPIVHCDLKPSNVLLDSDMTPKVSDFGLAKILLHPDNNEFSISCTHTLRGSIGYIPPGK
ncbi:hypothetical protein RD792_015120 [Penstemon davidsonii]|uniref:Protein kinase domain-containing protein n=1 Tax=Penstemon davidsonii TaxID=160366 RepID=A0ABR0CRT3_9LAMI|nr:hypothetical protein RD792_015120 [Penstemon davidsonii]